MMDAEVIRIEVAHDKPISGMWHCGPNPCWITATHLPTLASVRVYSGGKGMHQARQAAVDLLEMMVDQFGADPCNFPAVIAPTPEQEKA
ncbi:hypothetical protein [Falsirhodobacter xinxiangensis]|uniref:hypothetical protein n=1 Tax=Falsirhodobacter xinxiangensis TaxID=2530049 RepID=UPI0010AB1F5E|nr:hypothetical protein [Rhodobacter xinxiangensis]